MAFTAGMFHDIGQLVLDVCIPEQFAKVLEQQKASGLDLAGIERSQLGFDHAMIGAEMARRWNFPQEIERATAYWRTPEHQPFEPMAGIVHIAALVEGGLSGDELAARLPATLRERLHFEWPPVNACMPSREQMDAVAHLMLAA